MRAVRSFQPIIPNPYSAKRPGSERALFHLHLQNGFPLRRCDPAFVFGPITRLTARRFSGTACAPTALSLFPKTARGRCSGFTWAMLRVRRCCAAEKQCESGTRSISRIILPITQPGSCNCWRALRGTRADLVQIPREQSSEWRTADDSSVYFGVYLDVPATVVKTERVRSELGLELTSLEDGLRETFDWYRQQKRPQPDFSWEDRLLSASMHQ